MKRMVTKEQQRLKHLSLKIQEVAQNYVIIEKKEKRDMPDKS